MIISGGEEKFEKYFIVAAESLRDYPDRYAVLRYIPAITLVKWVSDNIDEFEGVDQQTGSSLGRALWDEVRSLAESDPAAAIFFGVKALETLNRSLLHLSEWLDLPRTLPFQQPVARGSLDVLIRYTGELSFRPSSQNEKRAVGDAFNSFLERVAGIWRSEIGENSVPRSVADLLARIAAPEPGTTVLDPTCGTGDLLAAVNRLVAARFPNDVEGSVKLHGQERTALLAALCRIRLIFYRLFDSDVRLGSALTNPVLADDGGPVRYDRIISNPPFGRAGAVSGSELPYRYDLVGKSKPSGLGDFAFVYNALAHLVDEGKAVLLLSPGVLFRGGHDREARQALTDSDLLEAIITLPKNVLHGTNMAPAVLVLSLRKEKIRRGKVVLIDASTQYSRQRPRNVITHAHIQAVSSIYEDFSSVKSLSTVVSVEDIRQQDYDWSVSLYVPEQARELDLDLRAEFQHMKSLEFARDRIAKEADELFLRVHSISSLQG